MDGEGIDVLDELLLPCGDDVDSLEDLLSLLPEGGDLSPDASELVAATGAAPLGGPSASAMPVKPEAALSAPQANKRARAELGDSGASASAASGESEEAAKKRRRLERNRASAQLSRERKRNQIDRLQAQVQQLQHDNCSLAYTLSVYHAELQRMHEKLAKVTGEAAPASALPTSGPAATTTTTTTDDDDNNTPPDTQERGHQGEDKPAALKSEMPSIFLLVAISTLLQAASCCLAGSLCLNTPEALDRVRAYRTSCTRQALKGLPNWQMDALSGADLTFFDGTVCDAG